jgi:hypothetical protein
VRIGLRRDRGEDEWKEKGQGKKREGNRRRKLTYRQFIQASYPSIKSSQPDLKFMIREAQGVNARAFVRFGTSLPLPFPFHYVRVWAWVPII